jgi:hypothetical protein
MSRAREAALRRRLFGLDQPEPEPEFRYQIVLPSGRIVIFNSIEEAREARFVLNGLTLEGKL